ncbi:MAG: N-6 DNA methylase [Verrucomicrobiota bacterium]|nr:N-6 DNA methylase [Verrucomicrobiota bacterium]
MKRMRVRELAPQCFKDDGRLVIVRRDDLIWSPIREMWLVETPEEHVRQEYLCTLVNEYGFKLQQIAEELEVTGRGSAKARADFVIWRTPQDKTESKSPLIVVECKADNVTIDRAVYEQGENCSRLTNARFFVTHNRRETKFWRVLHDKMPKNVEEIDGIPCADASDKEIEELIKRLKVFKEDEFADLLHQCHNIIRNREHPDPAAAFDEIAKILFMKVCFERRLAKGKYRRNLFSADFLTEQAEVHKDPVAVLFNETKEEYEADYLFAADEEIRLRFPTVKEIVKLLERYNLSDTSEDVKGIAFERFLGRTFRREIGQFFTPREIVKFMVEMVEPKFGDVVCDPASGSGGFLIRYFAKVREHLLSRADAEYAEFKADVEKKKGWSKARKAKALRDKYNWLQRDLDPKNPQSSMWRLANQCIYGTDANDRMARTSKMNMIMHGDGHGGVHHWNGFLNVNGIFEGRFDIILTNPPFGAHVEPSALVEVPEGKDWEETKRRYAREYGAAYTDAVARVEAAKGKAIASLFELPKKGDEGRSEGRFGKIKTELLFIERCLDLLKPGGRMGIVLPEGVFNNPSLAYVREFCEDRAFVRAVVSLPQETFFSSGASVKASLLFMQRFTEKEEARFDAEQKKARTETEAKYAKEIKAETTRLTADIEAAKTAGDAEKRKSAQKALADYERAMAEKIAAESRALLKVRWDYPVFMYEAEHVGITATGEADSNELYPNGQLPAGVEKSCLELFREFRTEPKAFAEKVKA